MDQAPATPQVSKVRIPSNKPFFLILITLVLILSLVVLNLKKETRTVATITPAAEETKLSCPVPQEFCWQAKILDKGESFYGLGYNLPLGSSLLVAFPGMVEDKPEIEGRSTSQPLLYIRDRQGNEAIYSFYGTASVTPGTQVLAGQELGKIGEGSFPQVPPFSGLNSFFSLKKEEEYQKIDPTIFAQ